MCLQVEKGYEIGEYLKDCTRMKSLVDDLVVTFDEIVNMPKTTLIKPNRKTNYWFIAVVSLAIAFLLLLVVIVVKSYLKLGLKIWCLLSYYYKDEQNMRNRYQQWYALLFRRHNQYQKCWFKYPNTLKIDEESYSNILIYYIFYVTTISTKPLHFIINNANGHIEENKRKKYLAPVPTNETKDKLKNYVKQQIITRMIMIKNIWKSNDSMT